jgi:hypothetical protein
MLSTTTSRVDLLNGLPLRRVDALSVRMPALYPATIDVEEVSVFRQVLLGHSGGPQMIASFSSVVEVAAS